MKQSAEKTAVLRQQPAAASWRGRLKKTTTIILAVLASVALFVAVVFTCFEWVAFDGNRFREARALYNLEAVTGMSSADLEMVTRELLLYCRGDRDNLELQAVIHGQQREVFDQREKDHMVDVQNLFVSGFKIRTFMVVSFLFLALVLVYFSRKRFLRELARGWLIAVSALGALLIAIGICFAVDFEATFTQFHRLFFTNDLWQLYPDEVLIQMLPGEFFFGMIQAIVIASAVALALITALAAFALWITGRKAAKQVVDEEPDDDTADQPDADEPEPEDGERQ